MRGLSLCTEWKTREEVVVGRLCPELQFQHLGCSAIQQTVKNKMLTSDEGDAAVQSLRKKQLSATATYVHSRRRKKTLFACIFHSLFDMCRLRMHPNLSENSDACSDSRPESLL
ncbi:hypothetical protein PROFUN_07776 [Planoprotostelium fungivorum]|uniref:Uncharacterized protein n=1 Tax=Planoprotostelium fungivorum TaxID=1890364 RepID=A0A2P6MX21_9EUKA|nr:hypothetical protein PROFUN_07776 [Planoprotostelium fungivorum]